MALEIAEASVKDEVIKDRHLHPTADIQRTKLTQRALVSFPVNLLDARVWDAVQTVLPATGGTDDLGLYTGTFGTSGNRIKTGDVKAAGAVTRRCRFFIPLPDGHEAGEDVQIRCFAGMETTVADVSATIDVEAYEVQADGTLSADLVTTAATTINSLTLANKDFTLTPTNLAPGDVLDVRVSIATNDAASATAVIGALAHLILRCDVRP